ncbi:siderophore-interacting protein [Actinocorallia longicatena]|uniref:FAD-binding FR-type domain-containing protein n=1 Tax=Actinocorallia longicatena TaxID=111803 RepID=A0ABP6QJF4_9ACTN
MARTDRLLDLLFVRGTVLDVSPAAGRMRAVRAGGVPGLAWRPGQQVRLHVNDLFAARSLLRPGDILRTYSVWDYDGDVLELRILDHGDGPGARWSREVKAGDPVVFGKPEGNFVVREADHHLFVGEETASVAFGAMMRGLANARAVLEVPDEDSRLPLEGDVTWLCRGEGSAHASENLVKAVAALDLPATGVVAYLAGEAKTCQAVKRHLITDRGWDRRSIQVKPFWTPGKRGME